jgi:glutaredoxin
VDTKLFLKEKQVDFTYYDVDVNFEKQKEMVSKLQKAGIPLDAIALPVVDLKGNLIMNNTEDFDGFLKGLIKKTK